MPWKGYLWQRVLKAYLHTVESWVWGSEQFSCWSWKSMIQSITCFVLHKTQVFQQQQDLTILLIRQWMTGTRGGAVRGGVGGSILISSSSSSVTLLSMKSTCSASPFTANKTCAYKSIVSEMYRLMIFSDHYHVFFFTWKTEQICPSSPFLASRGDLSSSSSSSSSSRFLWSLLTSAMRRERSEKSSADWTQRQVVTELLIFGLFVTLHLHRIVFVLLYLNQSFNLHPTYTNMVL